MSCVASFAEFGSDDLDLYRAYLVVNYAFGVRLPSGAGGQNFRVEGVDGGVASRCGEHCGVAGDDANSGEGSGRARVCNARGCVGGLCRSNSRADRGRDGSCAGNHSTVGHVVADEVVCEHPAVSGPDGLAISPVDLKPELVYDIQEGDVVSGSGCRGPNWARNRAARDKKKRQKCARRARVVSTSSDVDSGSCRGSGSGLPTDGTVLEECASAIPNLTRSNHDGFWNSCSKDVRQELIDSKARMHIAENQRKAREAQEVVAYLDSPEAMLKKAMSMVTMAQKCAKQKNDSKVAGWAETVATSYAESIAKSAPSSVPSYASVLSGTSASSVSVDGTKRQKPRVDVRKTRTYEGDPQHPAKSYYERRIKYMNAPGGIDNILDELFENKALAELDRTWLINDCYEKKARLGSPSVLAVTVD